MFDNKETATFIGNLILRGKFECLTGLHIGGSKEKLEIGGVDSPVVRDPRSRYPYVPGSSLKGKMRSLLEYGLGKVPLKKNDEKGEESGGVSADPLIVRLFGFGVDEKDKAYQEVRKQEKANEEAIKRGETPKEIKYPPLYHIGPSRLVIRDCHPDEETKKMWKNLDTDLLFTEYKSENGINRLTSAANPRFIERVAAGSRFDFEIVYSMFDIKDGDADATQDDLDNLLMALRLLEHNFLGKSGSRGYGRIKFGFSEPVWISTEEYKKVGSEAIKSATAAPADFKTLQTTSDLKLEIPTNA
jgi:CRISPR-associated protein Csm3